MNKLIRATILLSFFTTLIFSEPVVDLIDDAPQNTVFEISFDNPVIIKIDGGFSILGMDGFGYRGERYGPQLYGRAFNIAVPKNSDISVSIISAEWSNWQRITPSPICSLTTHYGILGPMDDKLYSRHCGGTARKVYDQIWRGVRVIGVDIIPVEYNPDYGVRFMKNVIVSVSHTNGKLPIADKRLYNPVIGKLYRASLVNPESAIPENYISSRMWNPDNGAELLVITNSTYLENSRPWIDWKLFMGMPTIVVLTDTIGATVDDIRNFVYNAYHNWVIPPMYLLIIGDTEQIPTYTDYTYIICDLYYCTVDGDDIFPDILPGRVSVDDNTQLQLFVRKLLNYEKEPDTTDDWFARAIGIVRRDDCSYMGPVDSSYVAAVEYAMAVCSTAGFTSTPTFINCDGVTYDDFAPYFIAGCNFASYRGQAVSDWWNPFGDITTLPSGKRLPIYVSITCATGTYHMDGYPAEYVTRAGTVSNPRGGVAWIGQGRCSSNSLERSSLSKNTFTGFFEENLNQIEAAHQYGRTEMYSEFGGISAARVEYQSSGLVGSPEMAAWTASIEIPEVIYIDNLHLGFNSADFIVNRLGVPVENARVCIHIDDSLYYGLTDALGFVQIDCNVDIADTSDSAIVVVTGPNIYPYTNTMSISMHGVCISQISAEISDITGDTDGLINPGETVALIPKITNLGDTTAPALSAVFRIDDTSITMLDSESTFPPIEPGDTVYGDTIKFRVSAEHPALSGENVIVQIHSDELGTFIRYLSPPIQIHRFEPNIASFNILDSSPFDNDNGRIEPMEHIFLSISLDNETQADCFNMKARILDTYPFLIRQDSTDFGDLNRGFSAESYPDFLFDVMLEAEPGSTYQIPLVITGECPMYPYCDTLFIPVSIALCSDTVQGPGHYGYYIIDETDYSSGLAPNYEWNDISDFADEISGITDSDDNTVTIALPFPFKYYGHILDSIAVCSNGFLANPWTTTTSPIPGYIPSSSEPNGIIAPMWSDLAPQRPDGGDIYSYYDTLNNRFIIQFDSVEYYYDIYGNVSFQIVIYDTVSYPTPTGDNEIYFYYEHIATSNGYVIGIESPDGTDGLTYYTYHYLITSDLAIESKRAIRITTNVPNDSLPPWLFYYSSLSYDDITGDDDSIPDPNEQIEMKFEMKNGGRQTAYSTIAKAISTEYISAADDESDFGDIIIGAVSNNFSTPIRFTISSVCPSDTYLVVPIAISANSGDLEDTLAFYIHIGERTGISTSNNEFPQKFSLATVYPNPFNSSATIEVNVPQENKGKPKLKISVYNIAGREISTIYDGSINSGKHRFLFDGSDLQSGIYFINANIQNKNYLSKTLLIK